MQDPTKPGRSKTGGRKKGTLNRRTQLTKLLKVEEALLREGVDPIARALELLPKLDPKDQIKFLLELASYIHTKPRAVETAPLAADSDSLTQASTAQLLSIVKNDKQTGNN